MGDNRFYLVYENHKTPDGIRKCWVIRDSENPDWDGEAFWRSPGACKRAKMKLNLLNRTNPSPFVAAMVKAFAEANNK